MSLWIPWWNVIWLLRPAFTRLRTFLWFATAVAGLTVRTELLGVTSIVRALKLRPRFYHKLLESFHTSAVRLDRLTALWTQIVLRLFPEPLRVNGRRVLVGDGIKVPKCGKKMPGVKLLHQQSDSNTKPEFIMGHSIQAISVLVQAAQSVFAVPLAVRIHEGLVWSNRDRRTLLDKMLALLGIVAIQDPFYFVADAYYAARKIVNGLLDQNNHLVTRVKSNAVAYAPYQQQGPRKRGRPRVYGTKLKVKTLLSDPRLMQSDASPVYGENKVTIQYRVCDLLWRPAGRLVRFVAVVTSFQRLVPVDVHGHLLERHRNHPTLWAALQDRTQLQTGRTADRLIRLSLLDARHETAPPSKRQSVSSSRVARLPQRRQAQDPRLSCLHAGWRRLPGVASVPGGGLSRARLELVRLLAPNRPPRHPSVGAGGCHCVAP